MLPDMDKSTILEEEGTSYFSINELKNITSNDHETSYIDGYKTD